MKYSQDQIDAIDGICDTLAIQSNRSSIAVLTGSAGTGKTTVVGEIIEKIKSRSPCFGTPIALCASTHRAANVLANTISHRIKVTTAHKLFKLRPVINDSGKETIVVAGTSTVKPGSEVIID